MKINKSYKCISYILILVMILSSIINSPIEVKAAQSITVGSAIINYSSITRDYDGQNHSPSVTVDASSDLTNIAIRIEYEDENTNQNEIIDNWHPGIALPAFKQVGVHHLQITVENTEDPLEVETRDFTVKILGEGFVDDEDLEDTEMSSEMPEETPPGEGNGGQEAGGGDSNSGNGEDGTPGNQTPSVDIVNYVKTEYLSALSNVNVTGAYVIDLSDKVLYLNSPEYREIKSFIRTNAYYDDALEFRNPFKYYFDNFIPASDNDGKIENIKLIFVRCDDFRLDNDEINNNIAAMNRTANIIKSQVAAEMSMYEKVLSIHDGMIRELKLDYIDTEDAASNSNWGLLLNREGTDQAFASLFYYFMSELGLECEVVKEVESGHAWNRVKIDSQIYNVDVAMDSVVLTNDMFEAAYANQSLYTMYGDSAIDGYDIGFVSHKFLFKTDSQMTELGYGSWKKYNEISNQLSDESLAPSSDVLATGIYVNKKGNIPYFSGSWYYANESGNEYKFIKSSFGGDASEEISTSFKVKYLCSDGVYLYYTDGDFILRTNSDGTQTHYLDLTGEQEKITEMSYKNNQLTYVLKSGESYSTNVVAGDASWADVIPGGPGENPGEPGENPGGPGENPGGPGENPGGPGENPGETECQHEYDLEFDEAARCNSKGKKHFECRLCGDTYVEEYGEFDYDNHSGEAEVVGYIAPDCLNPGQTGESRCSVCGHVMATDQVILPLGHDYAVATCINPSTCTRCGDTVGVVDPDNHVEVGRYESGEEPVVATLAQGHLDATCIDGYTGDKYCFACGVIVEAGSVIAPVLEHEGGTATCVSKAICGRCGNEYGEIDPDGHSGGEATCVDKAVCELCGNDYGEVDLYNHHYSVSVIPPSCLQAGYTLHECDRVGCLPDSNNHILITDPTAATGHTLEVRNRIEPTCLYQGYSGDIYCSVCETLIEPGSTLGALGHTGGSATCQGAATCTRCGETYGAANPNNHGSNVTLKNQRTATCIRKGYTGDTYCNNCGGLVSVGREIDYAEHRYTTTTISPTCTERGYKKHVCSVCRDTYNDSYVNELGHNYQVTTVAADSSSHTEGYILVKCSRCGDVQSNTAIAYAKTATLSTTSYTYNGSRKKPTVTIKDSRNQIINKSNYTVTYTNNLKVGKATVTVRMKGNYSGSFTKNFTIKPAATSITKISGVTKGFRVYWKKQTTQTTGYQIQYSTKSNFAAGYTATVTATSGFSNKQIKKLKSNKKYYVRIRTYSKTKVDGVSTNIYSTWSATKTIKAK